MALSDTALPYGLRDVQLFPLTGEVAGAGVDLPVSRTFSFTESEEFEELRGDDAVVAIRGKGSTVEWELEAGGVTFEAVKTMYGGTITESGTTPNLVRRYRKHSTDVRPYFKVEGQSISDEGGDFHTILYRCRATDALSGTQADGQWYLTGAKGKAIGRQSDNLLFDMVQNETATDIDTAAPDNEVQTVTITGTPTGGTWTLTFDGEETTNLDYDATAGEVEAALEALPNIGAGNVTVSGSAGGPYTVTFVGDLAGVDQPTMTGDDALTGGTSPGVTVVEATPGG